MLTVFAVFAVLGFIAGIGLIIAGKRATRSTVEPLGKITNGGDTSYLRH